MPSKAEGKLIRWTAVRGRNGWDAPSVLPDDMASEVLNVTFRRGTLGAKRHGSSETSITSLIGTVLVLGRFVPGQADTAAELFIVTDTPRIGRVAAGTTIANLTLVEAPHSASISQTTFATLNGKHYIAYRGNSFVNRLKVYDPGTSTSVVRYVGLATPAAPTVANTGSGSYAAVARYYRVQWLVKSGSTVQRSGPLGTASTVFTPSGSGTAARVTKPTGTSPAEGETHWRLYGSIDDANYFVLADTVVGTTTYDDSADPNAYNLNDAAPLEGDITNWPSVKCLCAMANRLLGFGVWESSAGDAMPPKAGRVYFSPVLDTSDADDDERVQNSSTFKGYIDVGRNSGAEDRGMVGPINNAVIVGQSRGLHLLNATGLADKPFQHVVLSASLGMVSQSSSFIGEDEAGDPCIYFLDPALGPYRYGKNGLQWLGYDVQDIWATVSTTATFWGSSVSLAHGVYHRFLRQCWWWLTTGSNIFPDTLIVFHVREGIPTEREGVRYGWSVYTGGIATANCSVMFANTFGATMSADLVPYIGTGISGSHLIKADDSTVTSDYPTATTFAGSVTSKAWDIAPPHHDKTLQSAWLQAKAATGVTIRQTLIRNFSDETGRTSDVLLTASGSETRVLRRFENAALAEAFTFQVKLGDAAAAANAWTLDQWMGTVEITERVHPNP